MPFSSIVASPEELAKISTAFDRAWEEIEACDAVPPLSLPAERERLGYIVAELWKSNPNGDLARLAVEQFFRTSVSSASLADLA